LQKGGPGGCTSVDECAKYCDDIDHATECVKFAADNGLMTTQQAQTALQLSRTVGPGGCIGGACRTYCSNDNNTTTCLNYALSHGIISPQQAEAVQDMLQNGGPGGCKSYTECKSYCSVPAHLDACTAFAQQHGLMQQSDKSEKPAAPQAPVAPAIYSGPGGCNSPDACKTYCATHEDVCQAFGAQPHAPIIAPQNPSNAPTESTSVQSDSKKVECEQYGGSWDGSKCLPPKGAATTTQKQCTDGGGSWQDGHCIPPKTNTPTIPASAPSSVAPAPQNTAPPMPIPKPSEPTSQLPLVKYVGAVGALFAPMFNR
jgi:hypothetical protein